MRSARRRRQSSVDRAQLRRLRRPLTALEELETRVVPSSLAHPLATPDVAPVPAPSGGPPNLPPYTPNAIRGAYGFNRILFLNPANGQYITGNGAGQTIAIVDAYDNPDLASNLATFDQLFGLPAANLVKIDEHGNPVNGQVAGNTSWGLEQSLDVEWAHALAPEANILLVEGLSESNTDLYTADQTAAYYTGPGIPTRANVISNSWGETEYATEKADDHYFTTTDNHATFVFSSGDGGAPPIYPSASPNVLSVGGTTLTMNAGAFGTSYASEVGWSLGSDNVPPYYNPYIASGGGPSAYESEPSYQTNAGLNLGARGTPDVALQADPLTGVYVLDTYGGGSASGWWRVGGTSFSAPAWSALLTDVNQGRVLNGLTPLGASAQADLYALAASAGYYGGNNANGAFRDITSGYNGYNAGPGYDYVTGIGTPVANTLAIDLATYVPVNNAAAVGSGGTVAHGGGGKANIIASAVPASPSLSTAIVPLINDTSTGIAAGLSARQPVDVAGAVSPLGLANSASLAAAAPTFRAFTAAPVAGTNVVDPNATDGANALTGDLLAGTNVILAPGARSLILGSPRSSQSAEETAISGWASDGALVADGAVGESPTDLAMATAMALAVSGSWTALDPTDGDRKPLHA